MEEPQENSRFRLRGANSRDPQINQNVLQYIEMKADDALKEYKQHEIPMPEKLEITIDTIRNWYDQKFKELGIDALPWPKHIIRVRQDAPLQFHAAADSLGIIVLRDRGISDPDLAAFEEARDFAHEAYHSIGISRFDVRKEADGSLEVKDIKVGANYNPHGKKNAAVEEGMAVLYEIEAQEVIRTTLPEGTKKHDEFIGPHRDKYLEEHPHVKANTLSIKSKNHNPRLVHTNYPHSLKFIEYLIDRVPNFRILVEQARVLDKPLPLARELRNQFGEDSFRLTFEATEVKAETYKRTLENLEGIKNVQSPLLSDIS